MSIHLNHKEENSGFFPRFLSSNFLQSVVVVIIIIIIIIIITLIKQIDKMQSYDTDELINVFEKHSVYIISAISQYDIS